MEFHDPIESCPYNVMHRIRRSRMQFHVITCAQNHKHAKMRQCPFDARHVIKPIEFEHHKNTCPARESVLHYAIHDRASQQKLKILPIDINPAGKWDEKWDDSADVKSYNPIKNIKNKPIVYPLIGVSKSKRKTHRAQERKRYNRVVEKNGINMSQNSFHSVSKNTNLKLKPIVEVVYEIGENSNEEEEKPLRPPIQYLATDHKTTDEHSRRASKPLECKNSQVFTTGSETDEASNDCSSSASVSSTDQIHDLHEKRSANCWEFVDTPRANNITVANEKEDQEKYLDPESNSIDYNDNGYQFYPNEEQEKSSFSDAVSIISSKDEYRFDLQQFKQDDYKKYSNHDTVSLILDKNFINRNNYQFEFYGSESQETDSFTDGVSVASSQDDYQIETHQYQNQEKCLLPDVVSMVSSKDNYQFEPYRCKDQTKCSITETVSMNTSADKYQYEPYQYKDQEKSIIPDAANIVSSPDKYQFESYQYREQEQTLIPNAVSIASSADNYRFQTYQYAEQKKTTIPNAICIVSSADNYRFEPYQNKNQESSIIPDVVSVVSSKDDYQFESYRYKDQEQHSVSDTVSVINYRDNDQFESCRYEDQEKNSVFDAASVLTNKDNYQFDLYQYKNQLKYQAPRADSVITDRDDSDLEPYQYNDRVKLFVSGADSVITDRDDSELESYDYNDRVKLFVSRADSVITDWGDNDLEPYQYIDQGKYSVSNAVSIISDREDYEFGPYQKKNQENYSISNSFTVISGKDEYQSPLRHSDSKKSLFLYADNTSTIDYECSYEEDDTTLHVLSKPIEKVADNNEINKFPITDEVYDVSSEDESECKNTSANWNPDTSSLSSETDENSSFKTAQSGYSSCNTTSTNSLGLGSAFEKLVQKIEELAMNTNDRGHKKKSESLDNEIDLLKKLPLNKKTGTIGYSTTEKLFRKCAANFFNLKS